MTAEEARLMYLSEVANAVYTCNGSRRYREQRWLIVDAASIALDMANAEASIERTRQSVAGA
jgi:hypothetical protein